jgi:ankyrin repeat protein
MVRVLLNYKADVNARSDDGLDSDTLCVTRIPGLSHSQYLHQSLPDVARLLLEHGADVNAQVSGS